MLELFGYFIAVILISGIVALSVAIVDIVMRFWVNHVSPWLDDKIGPL